MKIRDRIKKLKREDLSSLKWIIKKYPTLKTKKERLKFLKGLRRDTSDLIMLLNMEDDK